MQNMGEKPPRRTKGKVGRILLGTGLAVTGGTVGSKAYSEYLKHGKGSVRTIDDAPAKRRWHDDDDLDGNGTGGTSGDGVFDSIVTPVDKSVKMVLENPDLVAAFLVSAALTLVAYQLISAYRSNSTGGMQTA
jgi:hypothetical protein